MAKRDDEEDAVRSFNIGAQINLPALEQARSSVDGMTASMKGLEAALQHFGNNAGTIAEKINRHLKSIGDTAAAVSGQLAGVGAVAAGMGSGGGGGGGTKAAMSIAGGSGTGDSWTKKAAASASNAIGSVLDQRIPGGLSLGTFVGATGDDAESFTKDLAMAPLRYLRSRINTNRDTAIMASGALNMTAMQQGVGTSGIMTSLSKFPGNIYGTPTDLISMFGGAGAAGASYNFNSPGAPNGKGQGVRAAGYFKGIREMQMMNPMAQIGGEGGLASQLAGYAGDTGSQQRAQMFSGGAMGMIASGGRQKSLSEWAESILRWFEGLRPGNKRGKPFDYGELMAQYFPGSNIDAWFNTTGVPQNMRDYWWTYALAKTSGPGSTSQDKNFQIGVDDNNVAWQRLKAGSELTRTEFSLAGKMSGQYAKRESSNRWFNELMGSLQETVIPALSNSIFRMIQYLPDSVEDLMMTGVERGATEIFGGDVPNSAGGVGDIGDAYGATGGTGLSGLHPDMKSKIGRMMQANPKLRVNSGLRDTGLQQKLRAGGNKNVSGKPSAHTRGMAADLGPRSQYGWIARNAKRFGLASGIGHGEPWHVGMKGDIPGVGDVGDVFDDFVSGIQGVNDSPEGMATFITKLMGLVTGGIGKLTGGGQSTSAAFAESPEDLYKKLAGASQNVVLGFSTGSAGSGAGAYMPNAGGASITVTKGGEATAGTGTGWGGTNNTTWKGTNASGRGDKYNMTASPDIMADIQSNDAVTRGTAIAKALHNAGFTGDNLKTMLKIAYRESRWTTNQWITDDDDVGGGILGVNQKAWTVDKSPKQPAPYTQADVLDPQASAFIAMDMYKGVAPLNRPGGANSFYPWKDNNGNPLGGVPQEAGYLTEQALQKTGLGDIEAMQAGMNLSSTQRVGGSITFQNTFNLGVPTYGGGSNGGIDVRRTVTLLADHLEDEMKRRLKEERLMPYRYGIKNGYKPSQLAPKAYGWSRGQSYSSADVPSQWVDHQTNISTDGLRQQFAYEWFQSGDQFAGFTGERGLTNPPFVSGAAGRLHPLLQDAEGKPARILRGYIRRAEYDATDITSKARLYFMYNPETITRDYVSYLEQSALDPFNTVYQSGNAIAPPSILSFSFELFFDRQEESAAEADHPGVFVDYQFFDLVVRNVIPTDPNQSNNTLPDNGVMMVNPRDITVVFSPQITVQGRPTNASVTFEKFTHRMVPVRMRIRLQILASYFGPVRDMVEYKKEELPAEEAIPFDDIKPSVYNITFEEVERAADDAAGLPGGAASDVVNYGGQLGQANDANHKIRLAALQWAINNTNPGGPGKKNVIDAGWTNYATDNSASYWAQRHDLPRSADCSGLVTASYVAVGHGDTMGWSQFPGTSQMPKTLTQQNANYVPLTSIDWKKDLLPGDILIRPGSPGHTAFFVRYKEGGCVIFDASSSTSTPEVGEHTWAGKNEARSGFSHRLRPTPLGALGSAAQATSYNRNAPRAV